MRSVVNSCFVAFVLSSSGLTLAIYYALYGLCQMKPLDGRTYETKKQLIFGFTPSRESRYLYRTLFYLCISVANSLSCFVKLCRANSIFFRTLSNFLRAHSGILSNTSSVLLFLVYSLVSAHLPELCRDLPNFCFKS